MTHVGIETIKYHRKLYIITVVKIFHFISLTRGLCTSQYAVLIFLGNRRRECKGFGSSLFEASSINL